MDVEFVAAGHPGPRLHVTDLVSSSSEVTSLDETPGITTTANGIPGDPINVALVGTEEQITQIMRAAKRERADPLGLRSDLEIAGMTWTIFTPSDPAETVAAILGQPMTDCLLE